MVTAILSAVLRVLFFSLGLVNEVSDRSRSPPGPVSRVPEFNIESVISPA